jgi:hypothetical protein
MGIPGTQLPILVFSTGNAPYASCKLLNIKTIKTEENSIETRFSFDCNKAAEA